MAIGWVKLLDNQVQVYIPAHDSQMDNSEQATAVCQTMTSANQRSGSTTTEEPKRHLLK
jgi:hypothetical protein